MQILHFGDIHVWRWRVAADFLYPKRFLGLINLGLRRRFRFPHELAPEVASAIVEQDADYVVFSGDMTTMSLRKEFEESAALFEPIVNKWGTERFFCIPGNHDRYTPRSVRQGDYEKFFPYGAFPKGKLVRSQPVVDGLVCVGFDCSHPCRVRSNGTVSEDLEKQLEAQLQEHADAGRAVLLVGHYPAVYPPSIHAAWEHRLLEPERLVALIERFSPRVYFHGHKHVRWAIRDASTPDTLHLNCGAAGMVSDDPMKHAGFVRVELDESDGFKPIALERWTHGEGWQPMALPEA